MVEVRLSLSDEAYQRLTRMAQVTHQPLEDVVRQTIQANLPPVLDDVPPSLQPEIASLQTMDDSALWAIARTRPAPEQWDRHQQLLQKGAAGVLTDDEQQELEQLRMSTDQDVLRRSYALALLKWRGHTPLAWF